MSMGNREEPAGPGKLNTWDAVSIIVGIVIGTSIFKVPNTIFAFTSSPMWGLLVWVIGGLIALFGAYCYAEMGAAHPESGGDYFYLSRSFGPGIGFLFGWAQLTIVMPASIGLMAYVFADFLLQIEPAREQLMAYHILAADGQIEVPISGSTYVIDPHFGISAVVILILTLTNILGVVVGKTLQNVLSLVKIAGLLCIIVGGFAYGTPDAWEYVEKNGDTPLFGSVAMILVLYAYGGWNDSAFVAAEVRNPRRNVPRALFIGVSLIVVVYLLVNAAYINGLGWETVNQFGGKALPIRIVERTPLASWGALGMSVLVMISALGSANGLILTGPRVYNAMGSEHGLFGWMGHWRPGRGTPIMALLAQALLTIGVLACLTTPQGHEKINEGLNWFNEQLAEVNRLAGLNLKPISYEAEWQPGAGFDTLVSRTAPVFWFFFLLAGMSLFVLRERFKNIPRPYSTPWYPLVPLVFCAACAWMLYRSIDFVGWHALFALAILVLGIPLYFISKVAFGVPEDPVPVEAAFRSETRPQQVDPQLRKNWR